MNFLRSVEWMVRCSWFLAVS